MYDIIDALERFLLIYHRSKKSKYPFAIIAKTFKGRNYGP